MNFTIICWKISTKLGQVLPPSQQIIRSAKGKRKLHHRCEMAKEEDSADINGELDPKDLKNVKEDHDDLGAPVPEKGLAKRCSPAMQKTHGNSRWNDRVTTGATCYDLLKADAERRPSLFTLSLLASDQVLEDKLRKLKQKFSQPHFANLATESCTIACNLDDLKELLTKCIQNGNLTPSLIALAPSVSPRLWLEACQAYARQLRAQLKHQEAANYFIVCQQPEEAVKTLLEGFLHLEALYVARHHLLEEEIINEIVLDYAKIVEHNGHAVGAAECYIYLNKFDAAAKVLSSSKEADCLCASALAYKKAGLVNEELFSALLAVQYSILKGKPDLMATICDEHSELKIIQMLHEIFKAVQNEGAVPSLCGICDTLEIDDPAQYYEKLQKLYTTFKGEDTTKNSMVWRAVHELGLSFCAPDPSTRSKHILNALHMCQILGGECLYSICSKLTPNDADDLGVFDQEGGYGKSLRAYLCVSLVDRLYSHAEEASSFLPLVKKLYKDLLDEDSFRYHRAKIELASLERSLSQNMAEKLPSNAGNSLNGGQNLNSEVDNDEFVEDSKAIEDRPVIGSVLDEQKIDENELVTDLSEKINLSDDSIVNGKDNIAVNDTIVAKLADNRKQLLNKIQATEDTRGAIPNPMRSLLLLRNVCETLQGEHEEAKVILEDIVKVLPLLT